MNRHELCLLPVLEENTSCYTHSDLNGEVTMLVMTVLRPTAAERLLMLCKNTAGWKEDDCWSFRHAAMAESFHRMVLLYWLKGGLVVVRV